MRIVPRFRRPGGESGNLTLNIKNKQEETFMKTIGLKLTSLFLTLAMTATVLPLSAAAESETATDCTRSYTFDSADELNDF